MAAERVMPRLVVPITFIGIVGIVAAMWLVDRSGAALNELLLHLPGVDKVLHFGFALVLFVAVRQLCRQVWPSGARSTLIAATAAILIAIVDELQQRFVGGRSVEAADVLAGVSGIAVGAASVEARQYRRLALVLASAGALAAGLITYRSYWQTRDYNRGLLAERAGEPSAALKHYLAAVAAGSSNPEVYNAAAWTILQTGEGSASDAVRYAEHALRLRPGDPDTLDTYGWALYRAGRAREAVRPLEQALDGDPDIYCVHYHLGMAYLESERRNEAVRHLQLQVARYPETSEATLARAVLHQLGDSQQ